MRYLSDVHPHVFACQSLHQLPMGRVIKGSRDIKGRQIAVSAAAQGFVQHVHRFSWAHFCAGLSVGSISGSSLCYRTVSMILTAELILAIGSRELTW